MPGGSSLLKVDLKYDKISNIRLGLQVWGPQGYCMPATLQACSVPTDCSGGTFCDTVRGGCREVNSDPCLLSTDCEAPEQCYLATSQLGTVLEKPGGGSNHRLSANFPAFAAGRYNVVVYDHNEQEADRNAEYVLNLTAVTDPDTSEPNDSRSLAAELTSGQVATGRHSFVGDVDWYKIVPTGPTPAVLKIDMVWSAAAVGAPTWTLYQGDFKFESNAERIEGAGSNAKKTRRAVLVLPSNGPIYVEVKNTGDVFTIAEQYELQLEVREDPNEGNNRNDTPDTASVFAGGNPGASSSFPAATIVAQNDIDWYRVDRNASADNSLLYLRANAPGTAVDEFLLQAQVYQRTSEACDATTSCTAGRPCLTSAGVCLELVVQRPTPDGPGDPQTGGLSPNFIETQLPIFTPAAQGAYFVRIAHINSTSLPIPGYSFTTTYTAEMEHRYEPDPIDRQNPDNFFVGRPLAQDVQRSDFFRSARLVGAGDLSSTARAGAGGIAVVQPGTQVVQATCTPVTVQVFDAYGAPVTGAATVNLAASAGSFYDTCGGTAIASTVVNGGSGLVGYDPPVAPQLVTMSLTYDGNTIASLVPVDAAAGGAVLSFSGTAGATTAPPRGTAVATPSIPVRLRLSSNATNKILNVSVSGGGTPKVACAATGVTTCSTSGATGLTDACPNSLAAADGSCEIWIGNSNVYDLQVQTTALGRVTFDITDPASTYPAAKFVMTSFTPGAVSTSATAIRGYLSYDGDQDFFHIPASSIGKSGLSLTVSMPGSPIDIRARAVRGTSGASAGFSDESQDVCSSVTIPPGSCGTCDADRLTCQQGAYNDTRGVSQGECVYLSSTADPVIEVWVNDVNANDWDTGSQYTVDVDITEGCPGSCNAFVCGL